jgi:hypothetical protein
VRVGSIEPIVHGDLPPSHGGTEACDDHTMDTDGFPDHAKLVLRSVGIHVYDFGTGDVTRLAASGIEPARRR